MDSSFGPKTHTDQMAPICALLDKCKGPYIFLYDDGAGVHCVEDVSSSDEFAETLSAALVVLADVCRREKRSQVYVDWLEGLLDEARLAAETEANAGR